MTPWLVALLAVHPLHASTALVDIRADGTGSVAIRASADELHWSGDTVEMSAYFEARFLILSAGHHIPAQLVAARPEGDAIVFELRLTGGARCDDLRIWNGVLAERYADQVNLVQARCAGRSRHLAFSAGDGAKAL